MKISIIKLIAVCAVNILIISIILFFLHYKKIGYNFWTKDFLLAIILGFIASMPNFFKTMRNNNKKGNRL